MFPMRTCRRWCTCARASRQDRGKKQHAVKLLRKKLKSNLEKYKKMLKVKRRRRPVRRVGKAA